MYHVIGHGAGNFLYLEVATYSKQVRPKEIHAGNLPFLSKSLGLCLTLLQLLRSHRVVK